jgi:ABC-type nitrate/sulfonate/bicarbonate transport system ATPase subunit
LRLFADQEAIAQELVDMQGAVGQSLGMVAAAVPLISNLDVWKNIALIYMHHHPHVSQKNAQALVMQCLKRYGLEHIAPARNAMLSEEERFCVKVLRAAMVVDAVIVIDRPFTMLPYLKDTNFIFETLGKIDDLFTRCDILDYVQEQKRYGLRNDAED